MNYTIQISKQAEKKIERIPNPFYKKIKQAILSLSNNPRPHGYIKLQGREGYRIRVGDYRIIYDIDDTSISVFVITVMNRKDVYRK
jgi:mRNA interferase RelE/StbE